MEFNLLPDSLRPKTINVVPYMIVGGICLISILYLGYEAFRSNQLRDLCASYNKQLLDADTTLKVKPEVLANIQKLKGELASAEEQVSTLGEVMVGRVVWSRIMLEVASTISEELTLEELVFVEAENLCKVSGYSTDARAGEAVVQFASRLQTKEYVPKIFEHVKIVSCDSAPLEEGGDRLTFTLQISLKKPYQVVALGLP